MAGTNFKVKNGLEISSGTVVAGGSSGTSGQVLSSTGTGVQWVNASSGSGDVTGPASSTDNAVTRFDLASGKVIQNSTVLLDDNGTLTQVNGITLSTSPTSAPTATGSISWDSGDGTPSVALNANTSLQLGQENIVKVYNGTGSTIAKGSVVAVSGAQGQRPSVVLADADSEALSAPTLGLAAEAISNGAEGFVCTFGLVRGIDTSTFTAGNPVYLSSTAGQFTATKPVAPQHIVALGWIVKVNGSSGEIFVNINNGWEIEELHNVSVNSGTLASGNTLIYDATASLWKNASLTAGTGISVTNGAGSITVANTGVTSVSGTSPVSSSGGTTPAISLASGYGDTQNPYASKTANYVLAAPNGSAGVPTFRAIVAADIPTLNQNTTGSAGSVANALTISSPLTGTSYNGSAAVSIGIPVASSTANGYLSSTDWTTFNNKGSGTVTSVTGSSPVSSTGGTTPTISLASGYGDTQNPYGSKTANYFLAAPNGSAAAPTFRAIVAADIPTLNQNTTGSAGSVTGLTLNSSASPINPDNVTQNQLGYNTNVSLFGQTDGGLYSSAYSSSWIHQVFGDFRTGQIAIRGKNNGTWQSWRTVLDSSNYTSYSPSLSGSGATGSWGISVTGSSASCTGNASTATTATNLSGGSVAATTITASGTVTIKSGSPLGKLTVQTGGSDPSLPNAGDMVWYY